MIQGMMDLFIAPKAPETTKPVSVLGDAPKDFAKILEAMAGEIDVAAGTVQTVFDLIGSPSEEETETEEKPEEESLGIETKALPSIMAALIDILPRSEPVPAPLEDEAEKHDVAVALKMPTAPQIVPKDISEPEPEIMLEDDDEEENSQPRFAHSDKQPLDEPELPERAATAVLASDVMPSAKQPKTVRKNEPLSETKEMQEIKEIKETDAKAPVETPRPESRADTVGKTADVPVADVSAPAQAPTQRMNTNASAITNVNVSKEPKESEEPEKSGKSENQGKVESSGKFEKPEEFDKTEKSGKSEKFDKPDKPDPTPRRAAFSEFLTDIFDQKSARNDPTATAPTQGPMPQFNLLNTGRAAFTEGLESVVRFARAEGVDKATLIVDPPALGRVSIEIVSTAKGIETSLRVSNEQVRALVQDQIVQLKHALQQIGVQVAEFSVDIGQQEKEREQFSQKKQKNHSRIADKEGEVEEEIFRVDLRKGLLHWIA